MPIYKLDSQVVVFNCPEYGPRLLFRQGIANPRDSLGKNGVTLHNGFSSLFYHTIRIQAQVIDNLGAIKTQEFHINKNSLIKYLGTAAKGIDSDAGLINKLKGQFWHSDSNEGLVQRQIQVNAGEHGLRHAGRHNQGLIANWRTAITDYIKASFLGWLYQKTIGGIKRIRARFLFVRSEKDLLEAGEILAKKRFHDAYKTVPAYKQHMLRFNGQVTAKSRFCDIPKTSKENYIKPQEFDSDTHIHGKYPALSKTDTSTGTTGNPTEWIRGEKELRTVKKSLQLAAKIQYGKHRISYINAFALGPWATGLTTYELMRNTGSVFATGPDKEKILNKLLSILKYEHHQIVLATDAFASEHQQCSDNDKKALVTLIDTVLKTLLKNQEAKLADVLNSAIESSQEKTWFKKFHADIKKMVTNLHHDRTQIIIAGYPPFLKDLISYAQEKGHNFCNFSAVGVVGGQGISEAMRDQLTKNGFNQIISSYGASDLDINLGVESEFEISLRKAIETNPGLGRELYGENKGLPMIFHYDPMNYHVETDDEDNLLFTCSRNERSSPRIRYDLGDKGRVYASSDVQALLAKYGIFKKPSLNLPLMFVWGRDSTVVFNGAKVSFTELERAITTNEELEKTILKKAFYTYQDAQGNEKLEIWLELNDDLELADEASMHSQAHDLLNSLSNLNQDFRYQLEKLDSGTALPMIRYFKRHTSPISEAGGHRKQVLIFQKGINIAEDYQFPDANNCQAVAIPKTDSVVAHQEAAIRQML